MKNKNVLFIVIIIILLGTIFLGGYKLLYSNSENPILDTDKYYISQTEYYTPLLISGKEYGATFDNSYNVYLENSTYGNVYIEYDEKLKNYIITAKFNKENDYEAFHTTLIVENSEGNKNTFTINTWIGVENPDGGSIQNVVQIRKNLTNKVLKGWKEIYYEIKDGNMCTTVLAELK